MIADCIANLRTHELYSHKADKYVIKYLNESSVDNNIKARFSFVGMGLISLVESIVAAAATVFTASLYLVSWGQVEGLGTVVEILAKITYLNVVVGSASFVGSIFHPSGGIWMIKEGCKFVPEGYVREV